MVVDFGVAKRSSGKRSGAWTTSSSSIRSTSRETTAERDSGVQDSPRRFSIEAPKATTVLLEGEATVENLAGKCSRRIAPGMPENVSAVGVYVYEGLNKGAHLLAQVHSREVERSRQKR